MPDSSLRRRCGPKLANDPDRYLRRVKGGRIQARPYDLGERFDLGCFATRHEARKAVREWRLGLRQSLPRFVRKAGRQFVVNVFGVRVGEYATREKAARAALRHCRQRFGAAVAVMVMRRFW